MRLLLDSHIILWWLSGSPKLGARAEKLLMSGDCRLFVSAASWWELAIKASLGRLRIDFSGTREALEKREVSSLPITMKHAETAASLKLAHRDPFDQMLVAQAIDENLLLLTRDAKLKSCGSHILFV